MPGLFYYKNTKKSQFMIVFSTNTLYNIRSVLHYLLD
jgi:hypothetical protein